MGRSDPVLVVDDDPGMLRALNRLLCQHGFKPILFSSAEELEQHADIANALCIILDINLNGGRGSTSGINSKPTALRSPSFSSPAMRFLPFARPHCGPDASHF